MNRKKPFCDDASWILRELCYWEKGCIPLEERTKITHEYNSSASFENTEDEFIKKLIEFCGIGEEDVFLDLGSGIGKPVFQVAMETIVKEARGVELSQTRIEAANEILKELRNKGLKTKIEFILDTFLDAKHWKGATVVYSWACCFTHLLREIAQLSKACETLKYIALHDCSFEEKGIDIKEYDLERVYSYAKDDNNPHFIRNRLIIYRKNKYL